MCFDLFMIDCIYFHCAGLRPVLQTEQSEGRFCEDSYIVRKEIERFLQQEIEELSESSRRKERGCFTFRTSVIDVVSLSSVDSYQHYEWKILKY